MSGDLEGEAGRMAEGMGVMKAKEEGWGLYGLKLAELGGEGEGEVQKGEVGPYSTVFLVERERVKHTEAVVLNRVTHWGEQWRFSFLFFSFLFFSFLFFLFVEVLITQFPFLFSF